jgi:WD40 repeat protein
MAQMLTGSGTTLVAAADHVGRVVVWELAKVRETTELYGRHDRWVNAIALARSQNLQCLVSASDDNHARLWSRDRGQQAEQNHHSPVQAIAVIPDPNGNDLVVTGDESGTLLLTRADAMGDPNVVTTVQLGSKKIRALAAFERAGKWQVAAAGADASLTLIDPSNPNAEAGRTSLRYPGGSQALIRTLAAENKQKWLAAGDSDGRVTVWSTETHEMLWTDTSLYQGPIRSLAWVNSANLRHS